MAKDKMESLVRRAQSGDMKAMEKLLKDAHTSVSYQCRKMMSRQEDAEDLTQEVLLTVYRKLDTLKDAKAFQSWLRRITATHCMNALSRSHVDLQFAEDEDGHSAVEDLEMLDEYLIPDKALDNAETARMIDEIVSALPEAQRMTTLLYYYNEMSVKEIAQIMNVPENTVKSRLNLARKAIKEKVLDYEKQGIKLYNISVLPFLWYFLRATAERQADAGAAAACASGVVASASAATTTAATSAVATGLAAKVIAGCLALSIAIGGAALYFTKSDPADDTQQTPSTHESGTASSRASGSTSDLVDVEYVDVFSSVTLQFSGISSEARAKLSLDKTNDILDACQFHIEPNFWLKNGDTVTVTITNSEDLIDKFGLLLKETSKDFIVTGLDCYATIGDLPMNIVQQIGAQLVLEKQQENDKNPNFTYSDVELYGIFFLKGKEDTWADENQLHFVTYYTMLEDTGEVKYSYYTPYYIKDILVPPDGTISLQRDDCISLFFYDSAEDYLEKYRESYDITKIG